MNQPTAKSPRAAAPLLVISAFLVFISACTNSSASTTSQPPSPTDPSPTGTSPTGKGSGFDDHTLPELDSVDEYFLLAQSGASGGSVVKFSIPSMLQGTDVYWMDSQFYRLHDEWFWYRLLNGQPVPGSDRQPVEGEDFSTIEEIYAWASELNSGDLPLDLRWVGSSAFGDRLYSDEFYELVLDTQPRHYAVGSLVHLPANPLSESDAWLIELEYGDEPTPGEIAVIFERLSATLPDEIAGRLQWVVRSPQQDEIALEMADQSLAYHDRIVRYSELIPSGQVAVYNEGIAAGRLLLVEDGEPAALVDARSTDIVLVENVPDWLPPASALISSSPQTPLAHVNLLARNRGIPNASQAGILDDAGIRQAARVRAPAIVRATGTDQLEIVLISEEEYSRWRALRSRDAIDVPAVDVESLPYVMDLSAMAPQIGSDADVARWRPVIGGKSAGFLALLAADGVTAPASPLAITVRPYLEHLSQVQPALDAMLANRDFRDSARARFLFLEGPEDFADVYFSEADTEFAETLIEANPRGALIGDILSAGGFKDYFRDVSMDPSVLSEIAASLESAFGGLAATQGLRFRSSSSVEDIEGFSGAGLYDSNTGFLRPESQADESDRSKSIEASLKKTWSSYWSFEAFEERRLENVDHLSGAMGVLVHPRFDDPLEINNGVATLTLLPGDTSIVAVNVQDGPVSVTNPDPNDPALPDVIEVLGGQSEPWVIQRLEQSTIATGPVMTDAEILELVSQLETVTLLWRDWVNASLPPAQRVEVITLDFEFKTMAPGWPAGSDQASGGLVVKQARSLDPGLRGVPQDVLALEVPRDVLARARLVERLVCQQPDGSTSEHVAVFTDPLLIPDIGYSESPFTVGGVDVLREQCDVTVMFSTPDQFLLELLESAELLNLSR